MLVLTRKLGESVTIDGNIKVTIVALKGNQVKLGIEAPANMKVYREEIYTKITAENRQAATTRPQDTTTVHSWWQQWQQQQGEGHCR